jgi:DSF synthase
MNAAVDFPALSTINGYSQIDIEHNAELNTLFSWMQPEPRPCFTPKMLDEFAQSEKLLELHQGHINDKGAPARIDHVVFASRTPGVFNLGGDLNMFIQAIMRRDRASIQHYARLCVDLIYRRYSGFGANITTIALIQGKALGGGFECALACDLIVAERSSTFSFPESLFSLFPGMGALSFLTRKVGLAKAEKICSTADVFSADEMCELGVVDRVVEDGLGLETVKRMIVQRNRHGNTYRALKAAKNFCQPVTHEELINIVDVWADAAMKLETRDLRMMARLVKAQDRLSLSETTPEELAIRSMFEDEAAMASA